MIMTRGRLPGALCGMALPPAAPSGVGLGWAADLDVEASLPLTDCSANATAAAALALVALFLAQNALSSSSCSGLAAASTGPSEVPFASCSTRIVRPFRAPESRAGATCALTPRLSRLALTFRSAVKSITAGSFRLVESITPVTGSFPLGGGRFTRTVFVPLMQSGHLHASSSGSSLRPMQTLWNAAGQKSQSRSKPPRPHFLHISSLLSFMNSATVFSHCLVNLSLSSLAH
mmetsp:Transcript_19439/g.32678  ORF Transcript_19439/g.32678 Transcript_19439/m.32678 type:complete len:232 (+) Transcript_19439:1121-1816(+)